MDEDGGKSSSCDDSDGELEGQSAAITKIRESCASLLDSTPERFAIEHHLMLTETKDKVVYSDYLRTHNF